MTTPALSVIVPCRDMRREIPRTLASLGPDYQGVRGDRYEIELIEMPSPNNLGDVEKASFPPNLRHTLEKENLPLTHAVNRAVARTAAPHLLICVDGARILSSGIVRRCLEAIRIDPRSTLATHALDLGLRPQEVAVPAGTHDAKIEDALLESIDFPTRPNGLFAISSWARSSREGWFGQMAESCAILVPRARFEEAGGYEEKVTTPGGGLANADFYARITADRSVPLFFALGEATFRQHHAERTAASGGATCAALAVEFERQTGRSVERAPARPWRYLGALPPAAIALASRSLARMTRSRVSAGPAGGVEAVRRAQSAAFAPVPAHVRLPPIVLVLGMHRSGTSYVARQLVRNGLVVPGTPLGGTASSNPDGHFEPMEVIAWHNAVLRDLGLTWCTAARPDLTLRDRKWREWRTLGLVRLLRDLAATVTGAASWVVKDPRMCLLLPFWRDALGRLGADAAILHVLRHPSSVAASLHRRDAIATDVGRLVWARYVHEALAGVGDECGTICMDAVTTAELETHVGRIIGRKVAFGPLKRTRPAVDDDPLSRLYERHVDGGDVRALREGLAADLAFTERFPTLTRLIDPASVVDPT